MLCRFVIVVNLCAAFHLKCPEPAQWSTRARGHCPDPTKYFCLKNDLINGYSENCTISDFQQPGRKGVLRGGIDADVCSSKRYQPWPIKFYTNTSTNCIFGKSSCYEEGQVIHGYGSRNTDITCRCDYTKGYDFLVKPRNTCYCVPAEEDCSCYLKMCLDSTYMLSQDYECIQFALTISTTKCGSIVRESVNKGKKQRRLGDISRKDNISIREKWNRSWITTVTLSLCIAFIFGIGANHLLDRYYRNAYFICVPPAVIDTIEGEIITLTYRLLFDKCTINFLKNGVKLHESQLRQNVAGSLKTLVIKHALPSDDGKYCVMADGVRSKETQLTIQPIFTSKIEPKICLEGYQIQIDCSVYTDDTEVRWFKGEMERLPNQLIRIDRDGYQRKLTIETARLSDAGLYSVRAKKAKMEFSVIVKAVFRIPLQNVTIMEGLDAVFECETESENSPVEWFKDDIRIFSGTKHVRIEELPEYKYRLTIFNSCLQDSGNYIIKKKDIYSKAALDIKEMPETIKQMPDNDREEFLQAAKFGTARRYNIRVMIIGENSVGKTCLLRRLMNEPIDDVESTDGIDIHRRKCQVDVTSGEWHFSKPEEEYYTSWSSKSKQFADCGFWDFAGQKEFYATHQTFLSANAVYLLAADISKEFIKKTYNDMIEKEFDTIGEYIDFWLDNIHCYSTDVDHPSSKTDNFELNPPVIIVCTGMDKIDSNDKENRKNSFQDHLETILSYNEKRKHIRKVHYLSNTHPSNNRQEFKDLRKDIFEKAQTLKPWGDNLPPKWIVLEKEIYKKVSEDEYTMSYIEAVDLATKLLDPNIKQDTSELDLFLRYEHDIGNIIFFEDVKSFIVLNPKWLVEVLKCFVSHQYKRELIQMTEWSELEATGKLRDNLILKLLEKVPHLTLTKHKDFVLQIMEKFDIIVRPINDDVNKCFYMPCMIKAVRLKDIISDFGAEFWKKTSWFCLEFDFLPPSYINHILVSFVKENKLRTKKDNQLCIYRNIGLFDLNDQSTKTLIICLSKNVIAMQVRQWQADHVCYTESKNKMIDSVNLIKRRYRINIHYTKKFKCSEGNCYEELGRVDYNTVLGSNEYRCSEHRTIHSSKDIHRSWLTEEEVEHENKNKDRRRCHDCLKPSVNKQCFECNKVLCQNCSGIHDKRYPIHSMQPISDSYTMNCKFSLFDDGVTWISDIQCLPNGLLVATTDAPTKELMTCLLNGNQKQFIALTGKAVKIAILDKHTVAVLVLREFTTFYVARVDIQQRNEIQYINNDSIWCNVSTSLMCLENQVCIAVDSQILGTDISGSIKMRFDVGFTPFDMCYDTCSKRIYCIEKGNNKLHCIDRKGNDIFTVTVQHTKFLQSLTKDGEGNVLVLCAGNDELQDANCVIKVDSNSKSWDFIISSTHVSNIRDNCCISCDHSTDSVIVGVDDTVYIYKKRQTV